MNAIATQAGKTPIPMIPPQLGSVTSSFSNVIAQKSIPFEPKSSLPHTLFQNQISVGTNPLTFITDKILEVTRNVKSLPPIGESVFQSTNPLSNLFKTLTPQNPNTSYSIEPLITKSTSLMELTPKKEVIEFQVADLQTPAQRNLIDSLLSNNDRFQISQKNDNSINLETPCGTQFLLPQQGNVFSARTHQAGTETQYKKYQIESFEEWLEYLCVGHEAKANEKEPPQTTLDNSLWDSIKSIVSNVINHLHRILAL